jgi:hypothetical protein
MISDAAGLPHVNVSGAGSWLQHTAWPAVQVGVTWLVSAIRDTVTALASHHTPDPIQSLATILLFVAVIGVVYNRARARKASS